VQTFQIRFNVQRADSLASKHDFPELDQRPFEMLVGLETVRRVAENYAACGLGELFVIVGSSGYLEVSSSQASAAKILGCGVGAPVELRML